MGNLKIDFIRHKRQALGLSQNDVAYRLGLTQAAYWRVENGTRNLKGQELLELSRLLSEKPERFYTR